MHFFLLLTAYIAGVLTLVTSAFLGLAVLTSPVESEVVGHRAAQIKKGERGKQILIEPRGSQKAFRYGPEVNHGRSDTPVNASNQALKEARSAPVKRKQPSYEQKIPTAGGVAMSLTQPSYSYSGH